MWVLICEAWYAEPCMWGQTCGVRYEESEMWVLICEAWYAEPCMWGQTCGVRYEESEMWVLICEAWYAERCMWGQACGTTYVGSGRRLMTEELIAGLSNLRWNWPALNPEENKFGIISVLPKVTFTHTVNVTQCYIHHICEASILNRLIMSDGG